jgi:hypothetical protein
MLRDLFPLSSAISALATVHPSNDRDRAELNGDCAIRLLVRQYLGEGDTGMIVDTDMDELPADAAAIALTSAVAGDAMADFIETAELF